MHRSALPDEPASGLPGRLRPGAGRSDGRQRVIDTALEQFTQFGVGATSLQMIADAMGVSKAAVYYHFKAKDEIILAVAQAAAGQLEAVLDHAESLRGRAVQAEAFLAGFVRMVLEHRGLHAIFYGDVTAARVIREHSAHKAGLQQRVIRLLAGRQAGAAETVATLVALNGVVAAANDWSLPPMSDPELEQLLKAAAFRLLGRRPPTSTSRA